MVLEVEGGKNSEVKDLQRTRKIFKVQRKLGSKKMWGQNILNFNEDDQTKV